MKPATHAEVRGPVAQWLEQHSYKVTVAGSIPARPTDW